MPSECYTFTIYDSTGMDLLITAREGVEYYRLTTEEGEIIRYNQNFGFDESTYINTYYLSFNEVNALNFCFTKPIQFY